MTGKEWAIPIVLGLVAAGGLWALVANSGGGGEGGGDEGAHGSNGGTTGPPPVPDVLVPFAHAIADPGHTITFLVLAPHGAARLEANLTAWDPGFEPSFTWQGDRVAFQDVQAQEPCTGCPSAGASHPPGWPLPSVGTPPANATGPRLFHGGYNATKVTAYVFNETGMLLGSNAPANDTDRFAKHGDYFRLPSSAWYLGANATAPNGTAHLPGFAKPLVDRVRPQLDGLPEGGVASVRSNAYVALYGSLFVTIRVDQLVYAP